MTQFFDHYQPRVIGLIETELWPNLLAIAHQRHIPTILLNARLSAKSAKGYAKFAAITRPMLEQLTQIAAQDQATADRFIALGAPAHRVVVTGSLKFDLQPPVAALQLAEQLRQTWALAGRTIVVAASTHEPEENQIINIFKALHQRYPQSCLIVVPRHPERFDRVAELIVEKGWTLARRSAGQAIDADTAVYLADSMGELWTWYALAQMAFVGGSIAATGGHNPLEPARLGVPVVMGSHTFNFAQIVQNLIDAGGLVQVPDVSGVYATFAEWCEHPSLAQQVGQCGRAMLEANQGALARQLALIQQLDIAGQI
jgi:3-deoxy-D-manno-octulosonic-acid transferase